MQCQCKSHSGSLPTITIWQYHIWPYNNYHMAEWTQVPPIFQCPCLFCSQPVFNQIGFLSSMWHFSYQHKSYSGQTWTMKYSEAGYVAEAVLCGEMLKRVTFFLDGWWPDHNFEQTFANWLAASQPKSGHCSIWDTCAQEVLLSVLEGCTKPPIGCWPPRASGVLGALLPMSSMTSLCWAVGSLHKKGL